MTIIQTYTGQLLDVSSPDPGHINLIDIAHGLAYTHRFGGHTTGSLGYTVAQHSLLVAELLLDPRHIVAALLHDASEAYLGDVPSPIKKSLPDYQRLENRLMHTIARKYHFDYPVAREVREADMKALQLERQRLMMQRLPWPGDMNDEETQIEFRVLVVESSVNIYHKFLRRLSEVGFDVGLVETT